MKDQLFVIRAARRARCEDEKWKCENFSKIWSGRSKRTADGSAVHRWLARSQRERFEQTKKKMFIL